MENFPQEENFPLYFWSKWLKQWLKPAEFHSCSRNNLPNVKVILWGVINNLNGCTGLSLLSLCHKKSVIKRTLLISFVAEYSSPLQSMFYHSDKIKAGFLSTQRRANKSIWRKPFQLCKKELVGNNHCNKFLLKRLDRWSRNVSFITSFFFFSMNKVLVSEN